MGQAVERPLQLNISDRSAMVLTFASTLLMPLQFAILVGVAIAILLYVFRSSNEVRVVQFMPVEGGLPVEQPAPAELPSDQVTMLYPYGSLFFAATSAFEQELPEVDKAHHAVVILILRGHQEEGSTFIMVLSRYTKKLQANGGKLMLAGVSPSLRDQLRRTGAMDFIGEENVFMVQDQLGASMSAAYVSARVWLEQENSDSTDR
jgi:SulP family sulfate permease